MTRRFLTQSRLGNKQSSLLFLSCVLSIFPIQAFSQSIFGDPVYGNLDLQQGFSPDPNISDVQAGGSQEFSECVGYFTSDPTLNLNYEPGSYDLGIFAKSQVDLTIAVNNPSGEWLCNDDSGFFSGDSPALLLQDPQQGIYNIWVGTYSSSSASSAASLVITELDKSDWAGLDIPINTSANTSSSIDLDVTAEPNYGNERLEYGFSPDPFLVELLAGGSFELDVSGCHGYFSSAADFKLDYEANVGTQLGIFAEANADTTLAINIPNGKWVCNDDFESLAASNPGILFEAPVSGSYSIWVGTYSQSDALETNAVLAITELDVSEWEGMDILAGTTGTIDPEGEPNFGVVDLASDFTPDPYSIRVLAGGSSQSTQCEGYFSENPALNLDSNISSGSLSIIGISQTDTTLAVTDAAGNWYCNDDTDFLKDTNPGIYIEQASQGLYKIWIGTYSSEVDAQIPAQLFISQQPRGDWLTMLNPQTETETETEIEIVDNSIQARPAAVQFGSKNN
ncbi:MAG: hypothetical protein COC19_06480 [SAR86 cluster bacterium]|uniref:Peptidase C-terminal archaeal/bacterial domain-containing protein n=1 Tax=SAR86 cluster bacterium TaxID=2030880 RepID=A0A2A4MJN5_9GAMM|nr:MAG: hypothetical protein COC19_06480 [SAR86 cluster bacterium]